MSRSLGGTRLTTLSPIAISPPLISSRPAIMRSSVDLPQPDGPTSTQNSPSAMSTSTPRITCVEPKCLCTELIVTAATALLLHGRKPGRVILSRRRLPRSLYYNVVGPPCLEPADDVLRCLAPQLDLGLRAEERSVRRQDHPRMAEQPGFGRNRLDRQDVQSGTGKYSTIECGKQIVEIYDRAACRVDDPGPSSHALEEIAPDHVPRFCVERRVNADDVARCEESRRIGHALDIGRKIAVDEIRIACDHTPECIAREIRHALADAPQSEDAERELARAAQRHPWTQVVPAPRLDITVVGDDVANE